MTTAIVTQYKVPRVSWKGVPVVTSECLASLYGTAPTNIKSNFNSNKARFVEGKHFFLLAGQDLYDFKAVWVSNSDPVVGARARSLILWTERGAARHAKMLETDKAWDVFEMLEDSYFNNRDRRATMLERAPLHHDAIDIAANRKIALSKVYGGLNRWIGVKRLSSMTVQQVAETLGFSGRWKSNNETAGDIQRIEDNQLKLYGESAQLALFSRVLA